jgi:bifunctional non-homologous end joining protein LigD
MAKQYTENVAFCAQRKYDGVRLAVDFSRASPYEGYNRKGERVDVPESSVANLLRSHIDSAFIDGEWIAAVGQYVAFDLLEINGEDLRRLPYSERYATLQELGEYLNVATLFRTTDQKTAALLDEIEMSGEGLVYKKLSAPYMLGRQGVNVKLKLWASATVRVCAKKKEDGKASFATEVLRDSKWWPCGTVTLTKTADLPKPGTYREIKYLYVGNGGRLYQPEDLGPRSDVDDSDCGWGQLKIKQEVERLAA